MGFGNEKCKEIVENVCPYCGKKLIMNKRSFANHIRWCKSNPNYEKINSGYIKNLLNAKPSKKNKRILNCVVCGSSYEIECTDKQFEKGNYKKTCCDKCSKKLTFLNTNNEIKIEKLRSHYASNNLIKICEYCGKEYNTRKQIQKFCSPECAIKHRSLMYYKDADGKKLRNLYKSSCQFKFALNNYPDEFDFNLIKKYGWYKAKNHGNNLNGVSRDHIYSRDKGFENLIDPYIISHPANCQLLRHNDNISKNSGCDIELEKLIEKIKNWNQKYGEFPNTIDYTFFENNGIKFKYRYHI